MHRRIKMGLIDTIENLVSRSLHYAGTSVRFMDNSIDVLHGARPRQHGGKAGTFGVCS